MSKQPLNISPFCAKKDGRYQISRPWARDGWLYATDGVVIVRRPTPDSDSDGKFPKTCAEGLFKQFPRCVYLWPAHDESEEERPCRTCKGHEEIEEVCGECGSTYEIECPDCSDGTETVAKPLVIGGREIAGECCLKIQALGQVRYCKAGKPNEALSFACERLQGKVMPIH